MNCPNCKLPRFVGAAGYALPQCMCAWCNTPMSVPAQQAAQPIGYVHPSTLELLEDYTHCAMFRPGDQTEGSIALYTHPPAKQEQHPAPGVPSVLKLIEAMDEAITCMPCDCSGSRRDRGDHLSYCPMFDLDIAWHGLRAILASSPPAQTKEQNARRPQDDEGYDCEDQL